MSKFLNLIENNLPPQDLDKNREVIQELQRLFASKGITSTPKTFQDVITITLGDNIIDLQLKHVTKKVGEEDEDVIAGLLGSNPKQLKTNNPTAFKARNDTTNAVVKIAKKITTDANQTGTMS